MSALPPTAEEIDRNKRLSAMAKSFKESNTPSGTAFAEDLLWLLAEYASMKIEAMRGPKPAKPPFTLNPKDTH